MLEKRDIVHHRLLDVLSSGARSGILAAIWRHRLLFVVIFLSIFAISIFTALVLPARYLATSMAIVAEADPGTKISDVWAQKQGDPADLESQIMILRSPRLLKLALSQPGALEAAFEDCRNTSGNCGDKQEISPKLIEEVAKHYSMAAVGRSRVLSISYTSASPDIAMTMANALVTAYLDDQRGTESSNREVAAKWLWQEVTDLDGEIRTSVSKIEVFRRQNGLVQGATAAISSESLTSVSQQLAAAEQAKAQAQARLDAIQNIRNDPAGTTSSALESRAVADLKQQIATVANQLAANSAILGARHPQRLMLEASLALLQRQLESEINRVTSSAQKDLEAATSLVASLRQQVDRAKNNASDALSSESQIEGMLRDVEAKRQLYTQLYQRASELESERRSLVGSARLVSLAERPTQPYFPKKTPMAAAGLALGLFLAGIVCLMRDRLLQNADDAPIPEKKASAGISGGSGSSKQLKILGEIPNVPTSSLLDAGDDNLFSIVNKSMASSEFRRKAMQIATNVLPYGGNKPFLLLPTHADMQQAAFFGLVLARALGEMGYRTLIIECASTGHSLREIFAQDEDAGILARHMADGTSLLGRSFSTPFPELQVMAGAHVDKTVLAQIDRNGWEALSTWAHSYDVIMLHGPALLEVEAQHALRLLSSTDISPLICLKQNTRPDEMVLIEATLGDLGLIHGAAVLIPDLYHGDHSSKGAFSQSRRKFA